MISVLFKKTGSSLNKAVFLGYKFVCFKKTMYLCKRNDGCAEYEKVGFLEFPTALQFNQHWIKILRFVD